MRQGIFRSLKTLKGPATKGIILVVPVLVTFIAVTWLLETVSGIPGTAVLEVTPYYHINQTIKLASLLASGSFIVTSLGKIAETRYGAKAEKMVDSVFNYIPLVRVVYNGTKVTTDTILGAENLGQPVKINIGRMNVTGFKTGNGNGKEDNVVFVPTSPNITSGFVVNVEDRWIEPTDETVTEAITKVLSAGFGAKVKKGSKISEGKKKPINN